MNRQKVIALTAVVGILVLTGMAVIAQSNGWFGSGGELDNDQEAIKAGSDSLPGVTSTASAGTSRKESGGSEPTPVPSLSYAPDAIYGRINESPDHETPYNCRMKPGEQCTVKFTGGYVLTNYDAAVIRVGAYEDGSDKPVAMVQTVARKGSLKWWADLYYTPSAGASEVAFRIFLLDSAGNVIFSDPKPQVYPVS